MIIKNKKISAVLAALTALILCGCSDDASSSETSSSSTTSVVSSSSSSGSSGSSSSSAVSSTDKVPSISISAQSYPGASSAYEIAASTTTTLEIIEKAEPSERHDGDRLTYTRENVWSQGKNYTVEISGALQPGAAITDETTYVKGKVYGDFRLDIVNNGEVLSSLKINIPRDDIFLILDSTADGIDYGCDVLSNKETYGSTQYPDIIQLDFYRKSDYEVPQYARYFAIINGEITELDIYENGALVSPRGTHPKMRSAGLFIQHLCVKNGSGGYEVIQYEYRFDVNNKRLNRKRVRFTGYR